MAISTKSTDRLADGVGDVRNNGVTARRSGRRNGAIRDRRGDIAARMERAARETSPCPPKSLPRLRFGLALDCARDEPALKKYSVFILTGTV